MLAGEIPQALTALDSLKVKISTGLFSEFVKQTGNVMRMHVRSSAVDWHFTYSLPTLDTTISFGDLLSKLPDLLRYLPSDWNIKAVPVNDMTFNDRDGLCVKVSSESFVSIAPFFTEAVYQTTELGNMTELRATAEIFNKKPPQFTHAYVAKAFGSIPSLHHAPSFDGGENYSQVSMTYAISYFLGMLTRYFPTQWVALSSGTKGDNLWPAVSAAQRYVETSFPELILGMIITALRRRSRNKVDPFSTS